MRGKLVSRTVGDVTFCPTGGISIETAPSFLALKNVASVGGSWLTLKKASPLPRVTRR